jgi:succinyldiaminopimelate transaminase
MTVASLSLSDLAPHALSAYDADKRAALAELGVGAAGLLDLGLGDSSEPVAPRIREALVAAVGTTTRYPPVSGLPELREAIAAWTRRRFDAELDPAAQVQPSQGSKEAIFALGLVARGPGKELVALTTPGYAIPERGARIAGLEPLELPVVPDLDALDDATWDRLAIFWLNFPNNPTGETAPPGLYAELAARARHHGFVLASDEAYTELWWDEPPGSVLELSDLDNVLAFHSLSKRSGLTGYRSGFVAGDPALIAGMRKLRAMAGSAPTEFVQRAAIAAWTDEEHVAERRATIGAKRDALVAALGRAGIELEGSRAGLFVWARAPGGDADHFARALLARGVAVVPGRYFGSGGEGRLRIAPVPDLEGCERAGRIIEEVARTWRG